MKKNFLALCIGLASAATTPAVLAVDFAVSPGTSSPPTAGGSVAGLALVTSNVGAAVAWNLTLQLPSGVSASNVVASTGSGQPLGPSGSCTYDSGTNRIIVAAADFTLTALPAGTACQFDLTFPAAAEGTQFVIERAQIPGSSGCSLADASACPANVVDALPSADPGVTGEPEAHVATATAAPVPLTLSYNPADGTTITFAAGMTPGTAAPNQTIQVTATGTTGSASLNNCAISGAGASAFSVSPNSLSFSADGSQNLTVGCTYPTSNASATLTCSETDADSTNASRSWPLSCSAPNVAPTIASNPASGATVSVGGVSAGQQATTIIDLSATGGSGSGSASIACSSTGSVQISFGGTPSGTTASQTVNGTAQPTDLVVGVVLTPGAQNPAGTVTCEVADGAGSRTFNYTVNALPGVVPPSVIPASSLWSQLALIGLFLGLGGLILVGRRNG